MRAAGGEKAGPAEASASGKHDERRVAACRWAPGPMGDAGEPVAAIVRDGDALAVNASGR
jgi:hypothetical protein